MKRTLSIAACALALAALGWLAFGHPYEPEHLSPGTECVIVFGEPRMTSVGKIDGKAWPWIDGLPRDVPAGTLVRVGQDPSPPINDDTLHHVDVIVLEGEYAGRPARIGRDHLQLAR